MRLLLDTNAYSTLMAGDPAAKNQIRFAEHVYLAMPVVGELLYGFSLGRRDAENRSHLQRFLQQHNVGLAGIDYEVCEVFARIGKQLRELGKPIPVNDQWIASTAIRHHLTLMTADPHFENVAGLSLASWQADA
jgi:predicted nucleic acid-binding protein